MREVQEETGNKYATLELTYTTCEFSFSGMAKLKRIVDGLAQQTARKREAVQSDFHELSSLLAAHQRYLELSARMPMDEETMKIGAALIMNAPIKFDSEADAYDPKLRDEIEYATYEQEDLPLLPADLDLSQYPLWKIMREILRQVPEMPVHEIQTHLKSFGVKAHRMAIESAIAKHREQFTTVKRGREKFVAWKETGNAPATKYEGRGRKRKH